MTAGKEKFNTMFGNKALKQEIQSLKERLTDYESRNIELRGRLTEVQNKISDKQTEITKIQSEKRLADRRTEEIKKENEILRKYYDLDKEPSDEIKTKIHIDLELNRVKDENLKLIAILKQHIQYIPQPYPMFPFVRF